MYSTALSLTLPNIPAEQQAALLADAPLLSLYEAFAAVPDPRSRHGQRYDLPYLLTCLVAALLCNCNSLEAVGQWCRDQQLLLRRLFGPRDFSTPTGSLYRRLLPRLSVGHIELVLAAWVNATRSASDEEAVARDGKAVRGRSCSRESGVANFWHNATGSVASDGSGKDQSALDSAGSAVPSPASSAMLHNVSVNEVRRRPVRW